VSAARLRLKRSHCASAFGQESPCG
jgi:hypothetical protein